MSQLLNKTDLKDLTGKTHWRAQKEFLKANNIPYAQRKDGSIAVTWDTINSGIFTKYESITTLSEEPLEKALKEQGIPSSVEYDSGL
tara:strand:- start:71 stop:331 length:261 start_codon:yes stop_codon:yes gene_type:complete